MEGNEEIKVEEPKVEEPKKKKGNGLFTLFACLMTAFIVILSMQIGEKIGKRISGEDRNSQPKATASNSNSDSNSNSNTTEPTTQKYSVGGVSGTYELDGKDSTIGITLFDNGLYIKSVSINAPGCGPNYVGNYYIDGDGITLNNLIEFDCSATAEIAVSADTGKITEGKITLKNGTFTKTTKKADFGETTKEFVEGYIYTPIGQGYMEKVRSEEENKEAQ